MQSGRTKRVLRHPGGIQAGDHRITGTGACSSPGPGIQPPRAPREAILRATAEEATQRDGSDRPEGFSADDDGRMSVDERNHNERRDRLAVDPGADDDRDRKQTTEGKTEKQSEPNTRPEPSSKEPDERGWGPAATRGRMLDRVEEAEVDAPDRHEQTEEDRNKPAICFKI